MCSVTLSTVYIHKVGRHNSDDELCNEQVLL